MLAVALELDAAVTAHLIGEVGGEIVWQRKLAVRAQRLDHLVGGHAGGGRVPERQRRQAIGVNVLGAFFQLGEGRQRIARRRVARIVHLHENGAIPLDDERIGGVVVHFPALPWTRDSVPTVRGENGSLVAGRETIKAKWRSLRETLTVYTADEKPARLRWSSSAVLPIMPRHSKSATLRITPTTDCGMCAGGR